MNFVATACIKMRMTPENINAATINGLLWGYLKRTEALPLVKANLIITKPIPSYNQIPYALAVI
jgi:imidazolonepropionase